MEFKLKTDNSCEDYIYYGYHDESRKLVQFYNEQTPFKIPSIKEERKKEGNINYNIKYYTIKKKPTELHGFYGHFLLIKYNCSGFVEIENINPNLSTGIIVIIVIGCIFIIIALILIIYFFKIKKNEISNEDNNKNGNEDKNNNIKVNEDLNEKNNKKEDINLISNGNNNNEWRKYANDITGEEDDKSEKRMCKTMKINVENNRNTNYFKIYSYNKNNEWKLN